MHPVRKPWWQQATALVTVTTGGMITGFNFVPGAAATMTSPTSVPLHLLALEQAGRPGTAMNARAVGGDSADAATGNALLRSAIVNVAKYYRQLAATRTPAQLEALIWDNTSLNGADHGPSCAAFASLTLELAAQAVGQQSWVSGGSSYPWPLPAWADVRVDPNPASPDITSMVDGRAGPRAVAPARRRVPAAAGRLGAFRAPRRGRDQLLRRRARFHRRGLGAEPLGQRPRHHRFPRRGRGPGLRRQRQPRDRHRHHRHRRDLHRHGHGHGHGQHGHGHGHNVYRRGHDFDRHGHGCDSCGGSDQAKSGVGVGLGLDGTGKPAAGGRDPCRSGGHPRRRHAGPRSDDRGRRRRRRPDGRTHGDDPRCRARGQRRRGRQCHPGGEPGRDRSDSAAVHVRRARGDASLTGWHPDRDACATGGHPDRHPDRDADPDGHPDGDAGRDDAAAAASPAATRPAAPAASASPAAKPAAQPGQYRQYAAPAQATPGTRAQQAFISLIAPGAEAAQQRWGVPAAVTIAQAIDESAWGKSQLAADYHNLFGIKGAGPAGSVDLPTSEFYNGQWVNIEAPFRVYHNVAESIADHAELLATSGYYQRAMADRTVPDAFANDLTGVYATDPDYGASIIAIMKLYNLYRFDSPATAAPATAPSATPTPSAPTPSATPTASAQPTAPTPPPLTRPAILGRSRPAPAASGHAATAGHPTAPREAQIPGLSTPALAPTPAPATAAAGGRVGATTGAVGAVIPGVSAPHAASSNQARGGASIPGLTATAAVNFQQQPAPSATTVVTAARYQPELPHAMTTAYFATAKGPLAHGEHLYRDVAAQMGISWKVLAACDWMQCKSHPRYSPVHGEKIGALNSDGTSYSTKSAALAQCASDLIELAAAVYGIDLTARRPLSVRALADAFAAFRWGALLRRHRVSAMEFPYAVAGLTAQHLKMHWPVIDDPAAPDRPGAKFREPFGAVPVVLSLDYPATVLPTESAGNPPCSASFAGPDGSIRPWDSPLPRRSR